MTFPLRVSDCIPRLFLRWSISLFTKMCVSTFLSILLVSSLVYGATLNGQHKQETRCYMVNERYLDCGPACPKTCDTALQTEQVFCPELCVPGCFCIEGYVRNRWGNCIPLNNCPCRGQDEVFSCGSMCQNTCSTLNELCPMQNIQKYKCVNVCRCRDGFTRDNSGICIPISKCV